MPTGNYVRTPEMYKSRRGRTPWNKDKKGSQVAWNKGKHMSKKQKEKLSLAHKGKQSGSNNPAWKGGVMKNRGYVNIRVIPNPFIKGQYIKRSRIIMEKHIGRPLSSNDIVHHINGIKNDDRIENLQLVSRSEHVRIHKPRLSTGNARG